MMFRDVTLDEVLKSREERSLHRTEVRKNRNRAVIQLTLNTPGPRKNSLMIQNIFQEGLSLLRREFAGQIDDLRADSTSPAGPSAFLSLTGDPENIKKTCCRLEEEHPWGRLWDLDVYDGDDRALSRSGSGLAPRKCLICENPAHQCGRGRTHSIQELLEKIGKLYREHRTPIYKNEL